MTKEGSKQENLSRITQTVDALSKLKTMERQEHYHHCEKTQIEMVWAHNKISRTCKDDPTGHGIRREKER